MLQKYQIFPNIDRSMEKHDYLQESISHTYKNSCEQNQRLIPPCCSSTNTRRKRADGAWGKGFLAMARNCDVKRT